MDDLNQAIEGVLNNPEMMEKIMGMAQAFGGSPAEPPENPEEPQKSSSPDLSQLQGIGNLLSQANIDKDQQNLLNALSAYLSSPHIGKLKRAMQAARLAELANSLVGPSLRGSGDNHV